MPRLRYSPEASQDLVRFSKFFLPAAPEAASNAIIAILESIDILTEAPMIGRPYEIAGESGYQEFVIPFGKGGYVALYQYDQQAAVVDILAIRSQRELDYGGATQ
jgi:plasmid stabilization system protein ParE